MALDFIQLLLNKQLKLADTALDIRKEIDSLVNEIDDKDRFENIDTANNMKNDLADRLAQTFSLKEMTEKLLLSQIPHNIVPFVNKTETEAKSASTKQEIVDREIDIAPVSSASEMLVKYFTQSFKYLGPLRFREKLSPFSKMGDKRDVGITGEFTAAVFDAFRNESIKYISPSVFDTFQSNKKHGRLYSTRVFSEALNEWLHYLDISNGINVEAEENGYKVKINSNDNHPVNMTHVGTGVSQVLPILVSCLLAEPDSTLVFEQPELHLHPRVQSRLADFFLFMALLGKQCIIEIHSEYLIYALRYRISEALLKNDESIQNAVKLYFADKKEGKPEFQEIKVKKHREISAWPDGFFDERQKLSDRMLESILSDMEDDDA